MKDASPLDYLKRQERNLSCGPVAVDMKNVTSSWSYDQEHATLNSVSVCFEKDQLYAIIGPVGCGKVKAMPWIIMNVNSICLADILT